MKSQDTKYIKQNIAKLPDSPGVYFFKRGRDILYIGKATSLRDRVRSYFSGHIETARGPLISNMLSRFNNIAFQKTDSVLEALILEAHLIKKHQPPANIMEKDDRSFNYVVITKEDFPRVLIIRGRELENIRSDSLHPDNSYIGMSLDKKFGPFTNGGQLKEAFKIVRRLFPFRDKCIPLQGRPCFNNQIGLCPGVCTGEISKTEYNRQIKNIVLFFEADKKKLIKNLEKEMKKLAHEREFEKAAKVKRQMSALYHIQDVSLIKTDKVSQLNLSTKSFRIEAYDIAHLSGTNVVGVMTVVEDGEVKKSDYRKFKIRSAAIDDTKALSEVLSRRLKHDEWAMPDLIVVDGGVAQEMAAEKVIRENNLKIPVVSVVKDEKHKPREILGDKKWLAYKREILLSNAEAHRFAIGFHRHLRRKLV